MRSPVLPLANAPARTTRVLIAVTGDGRVRYAVLERSSGNEVLDGAAVAAARQVWFAPEPNADPLALTWVRCDYVGGTYLRVVLRRTSRY